MATVKYFGPGGQDVTLGSENDKWTYIIAKNAIIDAFKGIGNESTPVYFDENGVPKPATSASGGTTPKDDFFTTNDDGYLVPSSTPTTSNTFALDSDGYITIKEE